MVAAADADSFIARYVYPIVVCTPHFFCFSSIVLRYLRVMCVKKKRCGEKERARSFAARRCLRRRRRRWWCCSSRENIREETASLSLSLTA